MVWLNIKSLASYFGAYCIYKYLFNNNKLRLQKQCNVIYLEKENPQINGNSVYTYFLEVLKSIVLLLEQLKRVLLCPPFPDQPSKF